MNNYVEELKKVEEQQFRAIDLSSTIGEGVLRSKSRRGVFCPTCPWENYNHLFWHPISISLTAYEVVNPFPLKVVLCVFPDHRDNVVHGQCGGLYGQYQ